MSNLEKLGLSANAESCSFPLIGLTNLDIEQAVRESFREQLVDSMHNALRKAGVRYE